jgi:Ca-activated chloride channel family protein
MKMKVIIIIIVIALLPVAVFSQQVEQVIQKGNGLYRQKQYEPAEQAYNEALAKQPSNRTAGFNHANTAYRLSRHDDAIKEFDDLAFRGRTPGEKSPAFYNKGVVLTNQKKLEESIEAYKDALRQNPNDREARENLQKALLELKKKNPQQKKDDQKKKQQNKNQKQQPKMNPKEAEQKLKLLEQKEKELQQKLQKQKMKTGGGGMKDW